MTQPEFVEVQDIENAAFEARKRQNEINLLMEEIAGLDELLEGKKRQLEYSREQYLNACDALRMLNAKWAIQ